MKIVLKIERQTLVPVAKVCYTDKESTSHSKVLCCNELRAIADGIQAIERYNKLRPNLVLLDITMPKWDI